MGYYKILAEPMSSKAIATYKGLYRSEPLPFNDADESIITLWNKYTQYLEPLVNMGVTTELTLDELKHLAKCFNKKTGSCYEVVYLDNTYNCPHQAVYYGVDVTSPSGYSLLGENFIQNRQDDRNTLYYIVDAINKYFMDKTNEYGLFSTLEVAESYLGVLKEWAMHFPGYIEDEDWRIVHIFAVCE